MTFDLLKWKQFSGGPICNLNFLLEFYFSSFNFNLKKKWSWTLSEVEFLHSSITFSNKDSLTVVIITKLGNQWVMTSVLGAFVLIFAVVQLSDLRRQSVTEPEPMSSPIKYPA